MELFEEEELLSGLDSVLEEETDRLSLEELELLEELESLSQLVVFLCLRTFGVGFLLVLEVDALVS